MKENICLKGHPTSKFSHKSYYSINNLKLLGHVSGHKKAIVAAYTQMLPEK